MSWSLTLATPEMPRPQPPRPPAGAWGNFPWRRPPPKFLPGRWKWSQFLRRNVWTLAASKHQSWKWVCYSGDPRVVGFLAVPFSNHQRNTMLKKTPKSAIWVMFDWHKCIYTHGILSQFLQGQRRKDSSLAPGLHIQEFCSMGYFRKSVAFYTFGSFPEHHVRSRKLPHSLVPVKVQSSRRPGLAQCLALFTVPGISMLEPSFACGKHDHVVVLFSGKIPMVGRHMLSKRGRCCKGSSGQMPRTPGLLFALNVAHEVVQVPAFSPWQVSQLPKWAHPTHTSWLRGMHHMMLEKGDSPN